MSAWTAVAVGVLTLVGVVITAIVAARSNTRSSMVTMNATLMQRIESLEARQTEAESRQKLSDRTLAAAIRFIDRLVDWGRHGANGPMPRPADDLHDYLDPELFRD